LLQLSISLPTLRQYNSDPIHPKNGIQFLTLDGGVITAAVVMNELRRLTAPPRPSRISLPDQLRLQVEPLADCSRYDHLRGGQYVH
jgi:hypothetical protein